MLLQRILLVVTIWLCALSDVISAPTDGISSRNSRPRRRRHLRSMRSVTPTGAADVPRTEQLNEKPDNMNSDFVLFSQEKPLSPPWSVAMETEEDTDHHFVSTGQEQSLNSTADVPLTNATTASAGSRVRRSASRRGGIRYSICDSTSGWVPRTTAHDMWGNEVQVAQKINMGRSTVNQYFYETYCKHNSRPCTGIDTTRFISVCETKHRWVYARIINRVGEEGWNLVKIRGSCNCALYARTDRPPSIMDYLDRAQLSRG